MIKNLLTLLQTLSDVDSFLIKPPIEALISMIQSFTSGNSRRAPEPIVTIASVSSKWSSMAYPLPVQAFFSAS